MAIHNEWQFKKAATEGSQTVACLPQIEGTWCLGVKVNHYTAYLGNGSGDADEFPSVESALIKVKELGIDSEIRVISGNEPWEF